MAQTRLSILTTPRKLAASAVRSVAVTAALFAITLYTTGAVNAAADPAVTFVQKSATEAIAILSNRSLPDEDRRSQFRTVILKTFDAPAIARFVTEPYWTKSSPEQQSQFQTVFQGALAGIYTERFFDYDGQSLQIKATHPGDSGATVVQTTIATPTGDKSYDVDWIVAGLPGKEKFLDVVIDGISTSVTTQQDYGSVLRASNGNLETLTKALKAKVQ